MSCPTRLTDNIPQRRPLRLFLALAIRSPRLDDELGQDLHLLEDVRRRKVSKQLVLRLRGLRDAFTGQGGAAKKLTKERNALDSCIRGR